SVVGTQHLTGRDVTPPKLLDVLFDDADGNGAVSVGDRYRFIFDEPIQPDAFTDGTNEGNRNLSPEGKKYGEVNQLVMNGGFTEITVTITSGFTVQGNELVTPSSAVRDRAGNAAANTVRLSLADRIGPRVTRVTPRYVSPVSATQD